MLRKLSLASGLRSGGPTQAGFTKDKGKLVKYTPHSARHLQEDDDDLDEVAVISAAAPENVTYGAGAGSANGPRVVPGIITSTGFESKPYVPTTQPLQPK